MLHELLQQRLVVGESLEQQLDSGNLVDHLLSRNCVQEHETGLLLHLVGLLGGENDTRRVENLELVVDLDLSKSGGDTGLGSDGTGSSSSMDLGESVDDG